ncbi:MAG TPA: hypothetical protein DCX19_07300 [Alphaproteobacteria bacterium]|nr:hypothetical protein [Alphaproteobacteria bacterium]
MNLREMIVTDANGKTGEKTENDIAGSICPVLTADRKEDMFHFYAVLQKNPVALSPVPQEKLPAVVTVVRPLGGATEGAARFPRVGEKVLVAVNEDGGCYLMGYLPGEEAPFSGKDENLADTLKTRQGQVLRYKKTGDNTANEDTDKDYSEIGFYSETTEWKEKDGKENAKTDSATGLPFVDKIRIASTGDVETKAQNYNEVSAKRIGFFAGYNDDIDSRKAKQAENLKAGKTEADKNAFPVLPQDHLDESPAFFSGDIQMRAKKRIVLKAEDSIEIIAGHSIIKLDSTGIALISRKASVSAVNAWDSAITVSSRDGLSMFGTKVGISAAYKFALTDGFGGGCSSFGGVMRVSGCDVRLKSLCKAAYTSNAAATGTAFASTIASMGMGMDEDLNGTEKSAFINAWPSYVSTGVGVLGTLISVNWGFNTTAQIDDAAGGMVVIADFLMTVLGLVVSTLDSMVLSSTAKENGGQAGLTMAAMTVEYGLVIQIFFRLYAKNHEWLNTATYWMDFKGDTSECSKKFSHYTKGVVDAKSPVAGLETPFFKNLLVKFGSQDTVAIKAEVIGLLALIGGAAAGLALGYEHVGNVDDRIRKELEAL